jgi:hypothetical protein
MLAKSLRNKNRLQAAAQAAPYGLLAAQSRGYFSLMDRVRDRLQQPLRHIKSFVEPDGQSYETQLPETSRTYGNTAANLSAAVTHNALEMH